MGEQRIRFALVGPCVAWHRPKFTRSSRIDGRGTRAYKDKHDVEYQKALALEATAAMMRWCHANDEKWDASGEWRVDLEFHLPNLTRRDLDNLCKNAYDALTDICYDDDTQVVDTHMIKRLNRNAPRTVVTLERVSGYLDE